MSKTPPPGPVPGKTTSLAEREAFWQAHLAGWCASGLSQSGYSRRHGLRSNQLSYWHRRALRLNDTEPDQPSTPPDERGGFVPVQVVAPREPEVLSVRLTTGVVIEGITAANLTVARQLIAQL